MLNKFLWLWQYYKKNLGILSILIFLTPLQVMFQVTIPRMIDFSIDYMNSQKLPDDWIAKFLANIGAGFSLTPALTFGLSFVLLGLISSILYFTVQSRRAVMNVRLEWMFRQKSFDQATTKGPDFYNKFRTGDLVTRMTDDVAEKLSWFACSGIFRLYEALLMVSFTIAMMISIDPLMTIWAVLPLPILIVIFFISSSLLEKRYDYLQGRISQFNDLLEACFSGIRVVKAYVLEKSQKEKFEVTAIQRRQAEIDAVKMHAIVDSMYMYIWQFAILIVLVAGGYSVMNSNLSQGKLGSFIFYTVWLVFPMFDIGQFLVKSRQSAVSMNRLMELENMPELVTDSESINQIKMKPDDISFENVSFTFPELNHQIIDNVSVRIAKGSTVGVVGKVGSGKSWFVNMIPRLVEPTGGKIKIGEHELEKYSLADLRGYIGYVPQEPVLFSDTIQNNILMGREDISDELLNWAIDVSQLRTEIDSFPNGIQTYIGTRGMSISGGQKQRLGLARALVGKPEILILDDCTSALDSKTESALWDHLNKVLPDLTAILITHRPDTLEKTDNILVFEDGKIIENGHHDVLMHQESQYAKIYKRYLLEEIVHTRK